MGLAWGDVLGCPVEGWPADEIRRAYGDYDGLPVEHPLPRLAPARLARLRPLGLHSDDAAQAVALVDVCLGPTGFSPQEWARWLVEGRKAGAWRGTGRTFEGAVRRLAQGAPPQESGGPSAGIGAAMRAAALGALYRDDPQALARVAMESSAVTHADLRAQAIAFAVAHACSLMVNGADTNRVQAQLPEAVSRVEDEWLLGRAGWKVDRSGGHQVSLCLQRLFSSPPADGAQLRARVCGLARPHLAATAPPPHANDAFALLGGLHAIGAGLLLSGEPGAVLSEIVRQGADTDTVAAICGGLLGARLGDGWIARERLVDRDRLERCAQALVDRTAPPESLVELCRREAELTVRERTFQTGLAGRPP